MVHPIVRHIGMHVHLIVESNGISRQEPAELDDSAFTASAQFSAQLSEPLSLNIAYEGLVGSDQTNHDLLARLTYLF